MTENDIYFRWERACENIVTNNVQNWKNGDKDVSYMLEHLGLEYAQEYLENLITKDKMPVEEIQYLCSLNDLYGKPRKYRFNYDIESSTSSIRYCKHAFDIINLIKDKNLQNVNIVEVGGGYGGLCLILNKYAEMNKITINKYIIYDLNPAQKLQQYYLGCFNFNNIEWLDSSTFANDLPELNNLFLVSNYCLSEIDINFRCRYLENILHKVVGGYLAWNRTEFIGLQPLKSFSCEKEEPDTGPNNMIIKF